MSFEIRTDVFEGPFQLLLALISDRRVDVCDVSISQLCEDYFAHLAQMERMELEPATEFLVVAATLLQLKARALLPKPPTEDGGPEDDVERDLLIARLLEVKTFQAAGGHLQDLIADGDRRFPPAPAPDDEALRQLPSLTDIHPEDLARTLIDSLLVEDAGVDTSLLLVDQVSTQEAAAELSNLLERGGLTFHELVHGRSLGWAVAFFLAMLELAARGEVVLGQAERLGDIRIERHSGEDR